MGLPIRNILQRGDADRGCRPRLVRRVHFLPTLLTRVALPLLLHTTVDLWPRVAPRDDLAESLIGEPEDSPQAETRPTMALRGMGDALDKYWESLA